MNDKDFIEDIEHTDVTDTSEQLVTYNFNRSMQLFEAAFRKAYTNNTEFYEKSACMALDNLSGAIEINPDCIMLFNSENATYNLLEIVAENPPIVDTFASDGLMNLMGKYLSRPDLTKSNGDFNPRSIINCAKDDFGLDLLGKINIPFVSEDLILGFIDKL